MSKPAGSMSGPDWEPVLSAAARLQRLLPEAVLVGGTAAGLHAGHRGVSRDADHVPANLRSHFDEVLGQDDRSLRCPCLLVSCHSSNVG